MTAKIGRCLGLAVLACLALANVPAKAQVWGNGGYDQIDLTTNLGTISSLPFSYDYGNSFNPTTNPVKPGSTGTFYDDYEFTVSAVVTDSITSTINLGSLIGINNLQARLFSGAGPYSGSGGSEVLEEAWGTSFSAGGSTVTDVVLNPITLAPGTYTLEIAGQVVSSGIGSYSGVLNISAVPEADTFALTGLGLGAVVFLVRFARAQKTGSSQLLAA